MKRTIIALACTAIAPVAFAQTTTTTERTTTTAPVSTERTVTTAPVTTETSTTYSAGTVTTYEPGKTIVVRSEEGPVSFALGTTARVVNRAGRIVKTALTPGQRVKVYYTGNGERRVVERVVVDED